MMNILSMCVEEVAAKVGAVGHGTVGCWSETLQLLLDKCSGWSRPHTSSRIDPAHPISSKWFQQRPVMRPWAEYSPCSNVGAPPMLGKTTQAFQLLLRELTQ